MAYEAALRYLTTGVELVEDAGWKAEPQLTFELHLQRAEATYLCGRFEETEALVEHILRRADAILEKVRVLELLVTVHTTRLHYGKAIEHSVRALAMLGESVSASPSQIQVMIELARTKLALAGRTIDDLKELPRMEHPYKLAAMRVLMLATAPAYFAGANLLPLLALRMVRLSARYGNASHSAYGYVMYGLVLCGVLHDMPRGLAFGRLALELADRFNAQDIRGKVIMVFGGFILHWNGKLADTLPLFLQGANAALEAGDLEFHGYNRYAQASYAFMSGTSLDKIADQLDQLYLAVLQNKHEKTQRVFRMARQAVRDLRGPAAPPAPESEVPFDEEAHVALWTERDRMALAYYYKYRSLKQFMAHDFAGCLQSAQVIDDNFNTVMGMAFSAYYLPYQSLSLIALAPGMSRRQRWQAIGRVRRNQRRLKRWSRHAPENYLHKFTLVDAALARLRGRHVEAAQGYEQAIQLARKHGAMQDEAMAHELAGEFQLSRGQETAGRAHLMEARSIYRDWGALAWVDHLERRHPAIFGDIRFVSDSDGARTSMDSSESKGIIDVSTITRAARAISGSIVSSDVIDELMKATMVNAGARRGLLLLAHGSDLFIEAETVGQGETTRLQAIPFSQSGKVPERVVNYAAHTRRSVVLDDAPRDETFSDDPYIAVRKPLSVLCMPLVDKGDLIGLLYLENDLARGAFTPARIQTLEVLAAQAAISLENARLYRQVSEHAEVLEAKVRERTRELEDAYGKLREIFGKYVPRKVAEAIVAGQGSLKPTQTTATILYSDIEGFTSIAERMPPEQVMQMLNEYFPAVIGPIDRNGGIVNQFQGDAMLVTFNIPIADPGHAEKAVKTAIEMQEAVKGRTFAGVQLRTRIGINTGEVIAGNVGSGDRTNYTVYGDAVNLAARLEQLNKQYGTLVLVSGTTVACLNGAYPMQPVGEVAIRGKDVPVPVFKLAV
jgi:class 3 adenylate cyclase